MDPLWHELTNGFPDRDRFVAGRQALGQLLRFTVRHGDLALPA